MSQPPEAVPEAGLPADDQQPENQPTGDEATGDEAPAPADEDAAGTSPAEGEGSADAAPGAHQEAQAAPADGEALTTPDMRAHADPHAELVEPADSDPAQSQFLACAAKMGHYPEHDQCVALQSASLHALAKSAEELVDFNKRSEYHLPVMRGNFDRYSTMLGGLAKDLSTIDIMLQNIRHRLVALGAKEPEEREGG